jgi:L-ascorbate metabolism protein UlaG (beta-lactamase superfamily)
MEIYWLGHGCFRLRGRDATVLTDPCPPTTGYKIGKVNTDIVTISRDLPESSHRAAAAGEARFLDGPGEYEIAGVLITAVDTDRADRDDGHSRNLAFVIDIDDIKVCHLGDIQRVPMGDEVEELSGIDVLLVPVGGGRVMGAAKAAEMVSLLEPKIVIPMTYKTDVSKGDFEGVDHFIKEMGVEAKAPEQRLNLSKSNVPDETTLVLLTYRGA